MSDKDKKRLSGAEDQLREAWEALESRPAFRYDLDGDALYRQSRDAYAHSARRAMEDGMGRAAALTGGYGSSYAQGLGQQRYDETMLGLADRIPELEERAYRRWKSRGDELQERYERLSRQAEADRARTKDAYSRLYALIFATGYVPGEEELEAAGMSRAAAEALRSEYLRKTGRG